VQLVNPPSGSDQKDKKVLEDPTVPGGTTLFRETLNVNDKATYTKYFKNVVITNTTYLPYNVPEFHYFYTFHNDFVSFGNKILPTIGWAGGTFDPLD